MARQYSDQDVSSPLALAPFHECPPRRRKRDDKTEQATWPMTISSETPRATTMRRDESPSSARLPNAQRNSRNARSVARPNRSRPTHRERPSQRRRRNGGSPKAAGRRKGSAQNAGRSPPKRSRAAHTRMGRPPSKRSVRDGNSAARRKTGTKPNLSPQSRTRACARRGYPAARGSRSRRTPAASESATAGGASPADGPRAYPAPR